MNSDKPLRFMRLPELMATTGLKHTRIRELEAMGKFPKRVKIGDRANGWVESEINAWMKDRMAARLSDRITASKSSVPLAKCESSHG